MAHENATPRPWSFVPDELKIVADEDRRTRVCTITGSKFNSSTIDDGNLIAEAVNGWDALRAERDALREENEGLKASGWQPIETAPQDGTYILVPVTPDLLDVVSWFDGAWRETSNALRMRVQPNHWMPLPKGPQS